MSQNEVSMMKNELETQAVFAESLSNELKAILNRSTDGKVAKKDAKRVREIEELLAAKKVWATKAKTQIANYYRPATAC